MENFVKDFWMQFSAIHNATKQLYILAEEYDDDMDSFVQPIKEQRDALEHVVRAFSCYSEVEDTHNRTDSESYIKKNLDKAIGHAFRAFFDSADVFGIILREKISRELSSFSYRQIVEVWPEYEEYRKLLVDAPGKIAKLRLEKDIAKKQTSITDIIHDYTDVLYKLYDIYDEYMKDIYPKLNR